MTWQDSYQQWKNHPHLHDFERTDLEAMAGQDELLQEAFGSSLSFGTAGMRGILGAGTNRMNYYTVAQATQGLANWIKQADSAACQQGVVIAYDNRHFSAEFAQLAGRILGQNQIKAYVFSSLRPTPELSFAVRYLSCYAGIMITASHNPPNYNGYKVYNQSGGQIGPEQADPLSQCIREVEDMLDIQAAPWDRLETEGWVEWIDHELDQAYLKAMKSVNLNMGQLKETAADLSIVFTPLHGAGRRMGQAALSQAGFRSVHVVEAQAQTDPDFSTVASPNPEEAAAFDLAIGLGHQVNADILLATDPDADRLGLAVKKEDGDYALLSGNQMAALMVDYLLQSLDQDHAIDPQARLVKSLVSGDLPAKIAQAYGLKTDNVLTGFKFIADKIQSYEDTGQASFLFGFEESYGYLIQPFCRDKDAIQAMVLIAEMAAYAKSRGYHLSQRLEELYQIYGYYLEETLSFKMEGRQGADQIQELMADLRRSGPDLLKGLAIDYWEDYQVLKSFDSNHQVKEELDGPPSNLLKFFFTDGSWMAWRPSGTEPKIKAYLSVKAKDQQSAERHLQTYKARCQALVDQIK